MVFLLQNECIHWFVHGHMTAKRPWAGNIETSKGNSSIFAAMLKAVDVADCRQDMRRGYVSIFIKNVSGA